jgi:hypothetical protein
LIRVAPCANRMADEGAPTLGRRFRDGVRGQRYLLSLVILAIGVLLTILAVGDFIGPIAASGPFPAIDSATDQSPSGGPNYNLAFVVAGPIILIIGAYFTGAYLVARRRFEHLMTTKSKAEFLQHIPELEELLWDLTPDDEQRYLAKRGELRIRR